jgi:hypothetical protein
MLSVEVRGSPLPPLGFIDPGEPCSPNRTRAAHINCRLPRLPLTSGPHVTKTTRRTRTHDHYGAATEGPQRPVTSPPTSPTTRAIASPEKARPWHTTTTTTVGI